MEASLLILGDYDPRSETHALTDAALDHARDALGADLRIRWLATPKIERSALERAAGLLIAPGSPYADMPKVLDAIRYARENGLPCLGTCGGFQHVLLEYARNVLGFQDASHAEYDPYASRLFISRLACSLAGKEMSLRLEAGSKAAEAYGSLHASERYYCNFGVNPEYVDAIRVGPLRVTGFDGDDEFRVVEYPDHPYFVATLFVPQARSRPGAPHPLARALVKTTLRYAQPS